MKRYEERETTAMMSLRMSCGGLTTVHGLHDASDSPSAEISRLLNPSLSDDKNDQMSSDIGLDFGESSKFDPDSVLGSSYSLGREGDETDDLDLSITPNFETGLSCSPPSCFDSVSTSSSTATVPTTPLTRCVTSSCIPTISAGGSGAGFHLINSLPGGPAVVLGNVTAETLVSAVLNQNAKKSVGSETGMNSVSVTPAASGIWLLNTPPININPELLHLVKPVPITSAVQAVNVSSDAVSVTDTSCSLQDGTHVVLTPQDTREANPTSFLRLEDILVKQNPVPIISHSELLRSSDDPSRKDIGDPTRKDSNKRLHLSKSDGSESSSFSELFSFHDLPTNADVTQTKQLSECLPLTNVTSLAPDQPILQCSSSEEFQEVDERPAIKEELLTLEPAKRFDIKKYTAPTLIIEGLQEGSKLVKNLPSHKVPILPKEAEGEKNLQELKVTMPITCEEKSTPVMVHLIRDSDISSKDILYCQNIQTTLTEDLGQEMMEANVEVSSDEDTEEAEDSPGVGPQQLSHCMAEVVPTPVEHRKKYQRQPVKKKVFKCDLCNAKFEVVGNYSRHRKIHKIDNEKTQHKCDICGRGFLQRCDMKRHMLIHTKQEPHRCPTCGKGYIRKSDLVVHMRFHNKERPYKCTECSKDYYQSGDLKRHIRIVHSKEGMLSCGHCKRQYATETTLIRHMQTQHKDIILKSLNQKLAEEKSNKEPKEMEVSG